jgi:hypothetical protein
MATADVSISICRSDADQADVVVHGRSDNEPIASIRLLTCPDVHATVLTAFDATPADLSAALRRLADRVDAADNDWRTQQGEGHG